MNSYNVLEQRLKSISQIQNIINILYWDIAVNIPTGSIDSRAEEIADLNYIADNKLKSPELKELLNEAASDSRSLNSWQIANIREIHRAVLEVTAISDELRQKHILATTKCELIWREARQKNDYAMLKPYLQKVLIYTKEIASAKGAAFSLSPYDALIDTYDPNNRSKEIEIVFNELKASLPSLINQIINKQKTENVIPITQAIPKEKQIALAKRIMAIMDFDFNGGRLDESTHPCCMGTSTDVRITNRYDEQNILSGIMGIIHETGHALYEQGLPLEYKNQPVGKAKGMAIHESQSLFMEMQIARSRAFCEFLAKLLKDELNFKGAEYSADNLYKLATRVEPGFIRVDADEVTYPLHIIVRFEIEKLLISGDLTLDELPHYWNNIMQEYLGILPKTNKEGVLQDIHWPCGNFGYFPSYTRGAIIASMLMHKIRQVNSNLDQEITKGEFKNINKFLDNNIRNYGSLKNTDQLIKDATGSEKIEPEIFINYLRQKYLE